MRALERPKVKLLRALLLGFLVLAAGSASIVEAAAEVEIEGTIVSVQGTILTIDADGARLTLDASEIDPRFLETLLPGDEVRVAAFRLPDRALFVYSMFVQSRPSAPPPRPSPEPDPE